MIETAHYADREYSSDMEGEPHHYSSNLRGNERTVLWIVILALLVFVGLEALLVTQVHEPLNFLLSPTLPGIYYGLYRLFESKVWRSGLPLLSVPPNLAGTWVGNISPKEYPATTTTADDQPKIPALLSLKDSSGQPLRCGPDALEVNAIVTVTQSYDRLLVHLETSASYSNSEIADLSGNRTHVRLRYAYVASSRTGSVPFPAHRGLGDLFLAKGKPKILSGGYFAECPLHSGELYLMRLQDAPLYWAKPGEAAKAIVSGLPCE